MHAARVGAWLRWVAVVALLSCGGSRNTDATVRTERQLAPACSPVWNPAWRQGSGANEWWVEYVISGGTVQSAWLTFVAPLFGVVWASAGRAMARAAAAARLATVLIVDSS